MINEREYIVEYREGLFGGERTITVMAKGKNSAYFRAVDAIKKRDRYYGRDLKVVAVKYKNGRVQTLAVRGEK